MGRPVPDIEDPDRREYVTAVAGAMDERTERLGEFTAETEPVWAVRALGPAPDDPLDRLEWQDRAAKVAAYREMFGYDHASEAIGPEPVNSPEARAAWHAAFAALGPWTVLTCGAPRIAACWPCAARTSGRRRGRRGMSATNCGRSASVRRSGPHGGPGRRRGGRGRRPR